METQFLAGGQPCGLGNRLRNMSKEKVYLS